MVRALAPAAAVLFLAAALVPAPAHAAPAGADRVDAVYDVTFETVTHLAFEALFHVDRLRLSDGDYTAAGIRSEHARLKAAGGESAANAFVARLEARILAAAEEDLETAFPNALSRKVTDVTVDRASLASASASSPVDFTMSAEIERNRERLGLGSVTDGQVASAFAAGATYLSSFNVSAAPGYAIDYRIAPPSGLAWRDPSAGESSADGALLSLRVDNSDGASLKRMPLVSTILDPRVSAPEAEDVRTQVNLHITSFKVAEGSIPVEAEIVVDLHALDVGQRFPSALPARVELPFVSAHGLRLLASSGLVSSEDLARSGDALRDEIAKALRASLGATAQATGGFDPASLATAASPGAPVRFAASGTGGYAIASPEGADVASAFHAGASIRTDFTHESEAGRETTYTLTVPESLSFDAPSRGGAVSADGRSVTWKVDNRAGASKLAVPVSVRIRDAEAPVLTEPQADLDIVIDIKDVDVSVAKAAGGDFGNLLIDVIVNGRLGVLKLPDDVRAKLPAGVELEYLSSDAVRILFRDGLITEAQMSEIDREILASIQSKIGGALGSDAQVTGGLDRASLDASLVELPLSSEDPIVFNAKLSIVQPIAGGGEAQGQAALALYTMKQSFDLPRVEGLDTTYKIVLPRGLAVQAASATRGEVATGSEGGRDWFTVTPTGDAPAHATVAMAITPTFVVAKFWPVLLGAVLLLALVVGGPIALVARRRRRRRST